MYSADTDAASLGQSHSEPGILVQAAYAALLPQLLAEQNLLLSIKDAGSGRYLHVNPGMASFLQRPPQQIVGLTDGEIFDRDLAGYFRAADLSCQGALELVQADHRFEWAGVRRDFTVMRWVFDSAGHQLLCAIWRDRGAERLREAQLRSALDQLEAEQRANEVLRQEIKDQGLRDSSAGLYTRAHFEDQFRREIDLSMREHREFSLVLVDIDPWSASVREAGPQGQLRVVDALGRLLRTNTRAMDASCHLDGGRYAVLLSGVGLATAHGRMEQLRRQCATQIVMLDHRELAFTVSIGVASFPHTAYTREQLLLACDQAVAQARAQGNRVCLASIRLDDG
jgi:diguanylate cyclase (GGDEF)-like protein